jgi:hypothetical protein
MMCTMFIYVLLASPVASAITNLLLLHGGDASAGNNVAEAVFSVKVGKE